jgi:DNA-binding transcriptional MerR regulator
MDDEQYTLDELSQLTDVEPRTIRWYISEGLMRRPEGRGRGAYYTEHHRRRLASIKQMKDYGLSLRDIRKYCQMAGDEDIVIQAVGWEPEPHEARDDMQDREPGLGSSSATEAPAAQHAAAYRERARRMRGEIEQRRLAEMAALRAEAPGEFPADSPVGRLVRHLREALGRRSSRHRARGLPQHVIDITPELGLVLRGAFSREEQLVYEELADCLREWLSGGAPEE